jgi:hypothetical protein
MITLRKIDVGSAFRIGALVTGLLSLVLLMPLLLCQLSIIPAMTTTSSSFGSSNLSNDLPFVQGMGIAGILIFFVCGVLIYAVLGGIGGAIYALAYNFVARQFGGLQIEVDGLEAALPPPSKPKNVSSFYDPNFEQS